MFTPAICLFLITVKNDNRDVDVLLIFLAMLGAGFQCAGDSPITVRRFCWHLKINDNR